MSGTEGPPDDAVRPARAGRTAGSDSFCLVGATLGAVRDRRAPETGSSLAHAPFGWGVPRALTRAAPRPPRVTSGGEPPIFLVER